MTRDTDLADLIHTARGTMDAAQASIELAQRVIAQVHSDIETARRSIADLSETMQAHVIAELPASTAPINEHRGSVPGGGVGGRARSPRRSAARGHG